MRTKTLLIAAAALAVGLISSQAQTVYSANVVGYVTLSLPSGYSMICNQMDLDGKGTNNWIGCLGTNLPNNFQVLAWNGTTFTSTKWLAASQKWTANNATFTNAMQPHVGFFANTPAATNITLVGNVIQGTNQYTINAGYQVVSANVPLTGGMQTNFGYNPTKNDQVLVWNGSTYTSTKWLGTKWSAGEPTFSVGQAVFLNAVGNTNWTQSFTVQ
jgi:hypothetical protein